MIKILKSPYKWIKLCQNSIVNHNLIKIKVCNKIIQQFKNNYKYNNNPIHMDPK